MLKKKTMHLTQLSRLEGFYIETIGIIDKTHIFFLGIFNEQPYNKKAKAWLYKGTRMYEYALKNSLKNKSIILNLTQDPFTIFDIYTHRWEKHLLCEKKLCYLDTSYLVIPSEIVNTTKKKDRIELQLVFDSTLFLIENNIPLTNRFTNCLIETLVHLSRIEYYCGDKEKTNSLYQKISYCTETMKRITNKKVYIGIIEEINKRAEKCL